MLGIQAVDLPDRAVDGVALADRTHRGLGQVKACRVGSDDVGAHRRLGRGTCLAIGAESSGRLVTA